MSTKDKMDDKNLSKKDKAFLKRAGRYLNLEKWSKFLISWASALESYGTPREFVDSTEYENLKLDSFGKSFPFVYTLSANYEQRVALMSQQEDYVPLRDTSLYGVDMDFDNCFLCQNVAQAFDTQAEPDKRKNNVIFDLGSHLILPNRYPGQPGHSLSVPKNHDDTTTRVPPVKDTKNRTTIYTPENGNTRGNILTAGYLEALIEACDKLHFVAVRNHVLDGMSLPDHDHFHMMPEDLPSVSLFDAIAKKRLPTDYGSDVYRPEQTPFDTLMVTKGSGGKGDISEVAIPLLRDMEKDNQVFTLAYHDGVLMISPRHRHEVNDRRIPIGAGIPIHYFDTKGQEFIDRIKRFVPMQGEYNWERYVK